MFFDFGDDVVCRLTAQSDIGGKLLPDDNTVGTFVWWCGGASSREKLDKNSKNT